MAEDVDGTLIQIGDRVIRINPVTNDTLKLNETYTVQHVHGRYEIELADFPEIIWGSRRFKVDNTHWTPVKKGMLP